VGTQLSDVNRERGALCGVLLTNSTAQWLNRNDHTHTHTHTGFNDGPNDISSQFTVNNKEGCQQTETDKLTACCRLPSEADTSSLVKRYLALYGNRQSITVFTRPLQNLDESLLPREFTTSFNIILPSAPSSS
jgi:hypothetical protein